MTLLCGSFSCGSRAPELSSHERAQADIRALFPKEPIPLAGARLLEVLPEETLGVILAPGLRQTLQGAWFGGSALPSPEVRTALGELSVQVLGHDALDIEAMDALGVATDAPFALAALNLEIGALVLPLRDRKHFDKHWQESPETYHTSHRNHAIVAFPLGSGFDPTADVIRGLRVVARDLSLARHEGMRAAARRVRHGDDLLVLINPQELRRASVAYLAERRDYHDLETSRDMVELTDPNDRENYREARAELVATERAIDRLDTWRALLDGALGSVDGVAVGIGVRPTGLKVQAAIVLREGAAEAPATALSGERQTSLLPDELNRIDPRTVTLAGRVPANRIATLIGVAAGARLQQKVADLVAALGGHSALTGALSVAVRPSGRSRGGRTEPQRRATVLRIGVHNPAQVAAALDQQRKIPGWQLRMDGRALVLQSALGGRPARPLRSSRRTRGAVATLTRAPAMTRAFSNFRAVFDLLLRRTDAERHDALSEQLSAAASREQRTEHARLVARRQRLLRTHGDRLRALRTALADSLGAAALTMRREGRTLYLHGAQTFADPAAPPTAARIARVWYEHSQYSPYGQQMVAVESALAHIHTTLDMTSLTELLEDGQSFDDQLLGGTLGGSRSIGGIGQSGGFRARGRAGLPSGGLGTRGAGKRTSALTSGLSIDLVDGPPPSPADDGLTVTASITRRSPSLDRDPLRALFDRAVLATVPTLRRCHRAHQRKPRWGTGYLTAELQLRAGVIDAVKVRAATSDSAMSEPELLGCIESALKRMNTGQTTPPSGSATVTIWFGIKRARNPPKGGGLSIPLD